MKKKKEKKTRKTQKTNRKQKKKECKKHAHTQSTAQTVTIILHTSKKTNHKNYNYLWHSKKMSKMFKMYIRQYI